MNRNNQNAAHEQQQIQVLIVDPFPIFHRILHKLIRNRYPHVIITATDEIDQAYKIIKTESPGLVFLDVAMLPQNCMAPIQFIKKRLPAAVITVWTTHDSNEHKKAARRCGADYFFSKNDSSCLDLINIVNKVFT